MKPEQRCLCGLSSWGDCVTNDVTFKGPSVVFNGDGETRSPKSEASCHGHAPIAVVSSGGEKLISVPGSCCVWVLGREPSDFSVALNRLVYPHGNDAA